MSDESYQKVRNSSLDHNADIYPTLHEIREAKQQCYPNNMEITETMAKCSLQGNLKAFK